MHALKNFERGNFMAKHYYNAHGVKTFSTNLLVGVYHNLLYFVWADQRVRLF